MDGKASLSIAHSNQKAKNVLIFKYQVSNCIEIKFLCGSIKKIKKQNFVISKSKKVIIKL